MSASQRHKGSRRERELVQLFRSWNLHATRVPLSGATEYQSHDVQVEGMFAEVKGRANPIATLDKWMADNPDFVAFKADRKDWVFIVPAETMALLMKWAKS